MGLIAQTGVTSTDTNTAWFRQAPWRENREQRVAGHEGQSSPWGKGGRKRLQAWCRNTVERIREAIKAEQGRHLAKCYVCLKPRFGMELRKPGMPCVCGLAGSGEPPGALEGTRSMSRAICRALAWGMGAKFLLLMITRS